MRKKSLLILIIAAMILSVFAACSGENLSKLTYKMLEDDTYEVSIGVDPLDVKGKVNIPSEYNGKPVTRIEEKAFYGCKNLNDITIPETINSIGSLAFNDTGIWNESKANSVLYLGKWAIEYKGNDNNNKDDLTNLTIETGTVGIADNAFFNCRNLVSATIPDSVKIIGNSAFTLCSNLKNVNIPYGITVIESSVFSFCKNLTSITIPDSVTTIGNEAFSFCEILTDITIPDSVTTIEEYALGACYNLKSIIIPNSVTNIEDKAFSSCTGLTSIVIPESVTVMGNFVFDDISNEKQDFTIYVRASSKPTGWQDKWADSEYSLEEEPYTVVWDYKG